MIKFKDLENDEITRDLAIQGNAVPAQQAPPAGDTTMRSSVRLHLHVCAPLFDSRRRTGVHARWNSTTDSCDETSLRLFRFIMQPARW